MFIAESNGERILKIGQHVAKLWVKVGCRVFFIHGVGMLSLLQWLQLQYDHPMTSLCRMGGVQKLHSGQISLSQCHGSFKHCLRVHSCTCFVVKQQ